MPKTSPKNTLFSTPQLGQGPDATKGSCVSSFDDWEFLLDTNQKTNLEEEVFSDLFRHYIYRSSTQQQHQKGVEVAPYKGNLVQLYFNE